MGNQQFKKAERTCVAVEAFLTTLSGRSNVNTQITVGRAVQLKTKTIWMIKVLESDDRMYVITINTEDVQNIQCTLLFAYRYDDGVTNNWKYNVVMSQQAKNNQGGIYSVSCPLRNDSVNNSVLLTVVFKMSDQWILSVSVPPSVKPVMTDGTFSVVEDV